MVDDADGRAGRHAQVLRRWPRLWGADRALGAPGELSRPLSREELAHLHGLGASAAAPAPRRRGRARPPDATRPFLAVGRDRGGRMVVTVALASESAGALVADRSLLLAALARTGGEVLRALAEAPQVVVLVLEIPTGRRRATLRLEPEVLGRIADAAGGGEPPRG